MLRVLVIITTTITVAVVGNLAWGGVARRRTVEDPDLAYVAWHEISEALGFRSVQADCENVRELVYRVRKKLAVVLPDELIESRRGIGYRLVARLS